ncbi:uncharacterized protein [Nicotiana tomentosiformis]|uniref:uncharacterized protein n=1 Tax=Nicotiana tomentosiformis TaxID=4098 RepID=UPI00388C3C44
MGRHTVQKSAGVLELDAVSALSMQISTLTNQVNKMTLVINKQQAQPVQHVQLFCKVCGEGHTSDLSPVNPEFVYFVGNANRGQTNQYGNTYNPNWRNHPNFSWGGNQVGALPNDTEANPKASINAVSLRNGRQLEEVQSKKRKQVTFNVKPVQINIPLVGILQEVPKYAKYIKDIVANKKRLTEFETVALTEEYSSRIQSKLPQKLKDPGSFTIQISIGRHAVGRSLCDLGASINLIPLSAFRQLGLGEPRPTTVILQLADRSLAHPEGVIEDVLVQVGSFIFPANFIILDYEPD